MQVTRQCLDSLGSEIAYKTDKAPVVSQCESLLILTSVLKLRMTVENGNKSQPTRTKARLGDGCGSYKTGKYNICSPESAIQRR